MAKNKKMLKLKLVLVQESEEITDINGNHFIKRKPERIQYLTRDNYLLAEREPTEFDKELFDRFSKSS